MEGFPKRVLCISNKDLDRTLPIPQIGSEYTAIILKEVKHRPGELWYELAEFQCDAGYFYKPFLFSDLNTDINEMELVNQKEEYA